MSKRKTIPAKVKKVVTVKSGGIDCLDITKSPLFINDILLSEFAHIEAASFNGPRANENNLNDNSESNLILTSVNNHTYIDKKPAEYTTDILKNIKSSHEEKVEKTQEEVKKIMQSKTFDNFLINSKNDLV